MAIEPMGKTPLTFRQSFFEYGKIAKGVSTGKTRFEVLRDALKNKTTLHISPGKEVVFLNTEENQDMITIFEADDSPDRNFYKLRTTSGGLQKIADLYKSVVFGGGYGPKDATELSASITTARGESLQCYFCALLTDKPNIKQKDITPLSLKKYENVRVFTGKTKFKDVIDITIDWYNSAYYSAKKLVNENYIDRTYTFHRGDKVMDTVYKIKKKAFIADNVPILSDDKWNPGDIWALKKGRDVTKLLDGGEGSVLKLKKVIQTKFDSKELIGISLKIIKDEKQAKISIENSNNNPQAKKLYEMEGFKISGAKSFFSAGGATINVSGAQKLDVRSKGRLSGRNMDIVLKTARGGGIADTFQNAAAAKYLGVSNIPDNQTIKQINGAIKEGHVMTINKIWKMVETIQDSPLNTQRTSNLIVDAASFKQQMKDTEDVTRHSKLGCIYIIHALVQANRQQRNQFIDYVFNYAASTLPESTVYLKVYQ
jgi:hypothetical protein